MHKIRKERVIGSYKILVEFGKSVGMEVGSMILLYKAKSDIAQNCNNYRGICMLLNHTMKIWERMIEIRWREMCLSARTIWSMPKARVGGNYKSHTSRKEVDEPNRARKMNLHTTFFDLEKAYDKVPMRFHWCFEAKDVYVANIRVFKNLYNEVKTLVIKLKSLPSRNGGCIRNQLFACSICLGDRWTDIAYQRRRFTHYCIYFISFIT